MAKVESFLPGCIRAIQWQCWLAQLLRRWLFQHWTTELSWLESPEGVFQIIDFGNNLFLSLTFITSCNKQIVLVVRLDLFNLLIKRCFFNRPISRLQQPHTKIIDFKKKNKVWKARTFEKLFQENGFQKNDLVPESLWRKIKEILFLTHQFFFQIVIQLFHRLIHLVKTDKHTDRQSDRLLERQVDKQTDTWNRFFGSF